MKKVKSSNVLFLDFFWGYVNMMFSEKPLYSEGERDVTFHYNKQI